MEVKAVHAFYHAARKGENVMSEVVEEIARAGGELHVQNPSTRRMEATLNAE